MERAAFSSGWATRGRAVRTERDARAGSPRARSGHLATWLHGRDLAKAGRFPDGAFHWSTARLATGHLRVLMPRTRLVSGNQHCCVARSMRASAHAWQGLPTPRAARCRVRQAPEGRADPARACAFDVGHDVRRTRRPSASTTASCAADDPPRKLVRGESNPGAPPLARTLLEPTRLATSTVPVYLEGFFRRQGRLSGAAGRGASRRSSSA